uniref:Uncharacterized protein n=1 Tax=Tanacetum cinerariifolium TaxID=118510 RepID=A0A6L2MKC2_TANCI|nr:hypothetical protein [Tanacetum cinerariifolium]
MGLPSGYWWGEDNGLRWDCLVAAGGGRVWGRVLQAQLVPGLTRTNTVSPCGVVNDVTRLQALVDKKKVVVTKAAIREGNDSLGLKHLYLRGCWSDKRLRKKEMQMNMLKMLLLVMILKEMILLLMEKFMLLLKNHPYHLLPQLFHHDNHLKISLQHLRYNKHHHNHLRRVDHLEYDKVAQALEITKLKRRVKRLEKGNKARVLKLKRLKKVGTSQRVDTSDETVMDDESNQGRMIDEMDKDDAVVLIDEKEEDTKVEETMLDESAQEDEPVEVHEVVDVVTTAKLIIEVVTAASETVTAASAIISAAEPQVPTAAATITTAPTKVAAAPSRRRKGVVIRDPEEESTTSSIISTETKSKDKGKWIMVEEPKPLKKKQQIEMDERYGRKLHAEINKDIDWDVAIDHVKLKGKEDPAVQRYQVIKRKPQTEGQARKNMMMMYLKNVASFKLDYFKGMSYDDIRPIFEAKFNINIEFLLKTKEQIEEEENKVLQSTNETPAQKAVKRRKLNKEVKDLKRHLEIVPNEDDDVYTEATSLSRKVPVVDYKIIELNNKPYYKIIRGDGTHQLYISFLTLLKNFDREDLEALWSLVKERLKSGRIKGLYMVKKRSRARSYWNYVMKTKLMLIDDINDGQ